MLTPRSFHEQAGVSDWRVLYGGPQALFRCRSYEAGAAFVAEIAQLAAERHLAPSIDLRAEAVVVRLTPSGEGIAREEVELARRVSQAATEMGLGADPSALQAVGIAIAQHESVDTSPFWAATFGWDAREAAVLRDPLQRLPHLWIDEIDRAGRGRTHLDIAVPADFAAVRVAAILEAGGRLVDDSHAPDWWTLASPDNHGIDIVAWIDVDDGTSTETVEVAR